MKLHATKTQLNTIRHKQNKFFRPKWTKTKLPAGNRKMKTAKLRPKKDKKPPFSSALISSPGSKAKQQSNKEAEKMENFKSGARPLRTLPRAARSGDRSHFTYTRDPRDPRDTISKVLQHGRVPSDREFGQC